MRRLALQGSARRPLTRLHRWSGLILLALTEDGPHKLNYDPHRALGIALLPIWIVLGVHLVLSELSRPGAGACNT